MQAIQRNHQKVACMGAALSLMVFTFIANFGIPSPIPFETCLRVALVVGGFVAVLGLSVGISLAVAAAVVFLFAGIGVVSSVASGGISYRGDTALIRCLSYAFEGIEVSIRGLVLALPVIGWSWLAYDPSLFDGAVTVTPIGAASILASTASAGVCLARSQKAFHESFNTSLKIQTITGSFGAKRWISAFAVGFAISNALFAIAALAF